ncbi:MAG: dephospho-CoA kinase [Chitinophagales bacterium]|nr:dephospho-CoA kinase [Chitinophagales bacterium]MDW8394397.1 dephospho-CoA kinase [Chitinophagales bacterium]
MPRHGGLTGNLGAGKSTVARLFALLGIAVYDADRQAKNMLVQPAVLEALRQRFGLKVIGQELQTAALAEVVFSDPQHLQWLNGIIHPLVKADYLIWRQQQQGPYTLAEAALIYESGMDALMDFVIAVTAPEPLRLQRVQLRSGFSAEQFHRRQRHQLPQEQILQRATFRIDNHEAAALIPQVYALHQQLCEAHG